jgi:hypothetical protein
MNRVVTNPSGRMEAVLEYLDAAFHVKRPGAFVRCAITDAPILLDDLKYWSIEAQEPYIDAGAVLTSLERTRRG